MPASPRRLLTSVTALSIAGLLLGSLTASPAVAQPAVPEPAPSIEPSVTGLQPDRFIVKFRDMAQTSSADRIDTFDATGELGIVVEEVRPTGDGGVIVEATEDLTVNQVSEVIATLEAQADVEYAEVDQFAKPAAATNDTYSNWQWNLFEAQGGMRVPDAWKTATGAGITVAVIDTGSTPHSDLARNSIPGWDFITDTATSVDGDGRDADPNDPGDSCEGGPSSWHGTHVAGIIGAEANNAKGVAGVAYNSKVQHIRAVGACGGWSSDIAPAIIWAAGGPVAGVPTNPTPARVINLSLAGEGLCSTTYQNAINYAVDRGTVVVAAAGNGSSPAMFASPANCQNVIAVGATGREGSQAPYSNYGEEIDVSAPGGDSYTGYESAIISTDNAGHQVQGEEMYELKQGTSMAAPHVAGTAALMLSANMQLTPAQLEQTMKDTARSLPGACSGGCGTGIVDAAAAVVAAAPARPDVVSATPTVSGNSRVGSTLRAVPGTWTPAPVNLAYQWLRDGQAISGASAITHVVTTADTGKKLSVRVTGTKAGYDSATQTSAPTAAVTDPANDVVAPTPTITNGDTAQVGEELTARVGTWLPAPVTLTYQWLRSGSAISGATGATYTPVPADLGKTLTLRVTGKSSVMPSTARTSTATKAVLPGALSAVQPTVSGFAAIGYTLTAKPGTWAAGTTVTYQWLRDGANISGANSVTYRLVAADATKRLSVKATGTKAGYTTVSSTSAQTDTVPTPFKDVPVGTQFHREMSWMAAEGISTGWTEKNGTKTYRPLTTVNRDAMAAFMYRMAGSPAYTPPAKSPFADVSTKQEFYKEMAWLASRGISTGWTAKNGTRTYRALEPVNRDAMAAFMYRLAGSPQFTAPAKSPFADISPKQQFYKEMSWLASTGISTGWTSGSTKTYRALTPVNRDAMAAFMYRFAAKF
ncbi:S8 family serine peptidase [Arthrobacter sp. AET 35A]|uniref:S8 family serine peptidase n=1 Tax=Arthrobacter sp. AET 35A TaxID=2292643 RepID=UPI001CE242D9|nr:S8 family serine peptidase [Arthrobacter sp. AET 35A]MBE0011160.1 serine protease [Arthrobacter sp. AET 35A]